MISIAFYIVEHGSDNIEDSLLMSLEGLTKLVSSSRHFKLYQALIQVLTIYKLYFVRLMYQKHSTDKNITLIYIEYLRNYVTPKYTISLHGSIFVDLQFNCT